jgi:hypothetical protein
MYCIQRRRFQRESGLSHESFSLTGGCLQGGTVRERQLVAAGSAKLRTAVSSSLKTSKTR